MNENVLLQNNSQDNGEPSHYSLNGLDLSSKFSAKLSQKSSEIIQDNSSPKKANTSTVSNSSGKGKKRKKVLRDSTAPKQPLTGYFRFLNDRREKVRNENPSMPFSEITKQLAAEWNVLPTDQKQHYLDAAEQDKERYVKEFNAYKQTDAYKSFMEKQKAQKSKKESKKEKNGTNKMEVDSCSTVSIAPTKKKEAQKEKDDGESQDIQIFTDEFLEHNKVMEAELRQLRKSTTDYESQNAVLQRHVDSLSTAVNQLETDTTYQKATNEALQRHLDIMRSQLVSCLSNVPLIGIYEGATLQNIDSYIEKLEILINTNMETSLRNAIRSAVSRIDFIK